VRDVKDLNLKGSVEGGLGSSWRWGMQYDQGQCQTAPKAAFLRGNLLRGPGGQAVDADVSADFLDRSLWGRLKARLTPFVAAVVEADSREENYVTGVGLQTNFDIFGSRGAAQGVYRLPTRDVAFNWDQSLAGRTQASLSSIVPVDQERIPLDGKASLRLKHALTSQDMLGASVNLRNLSDFDLSYNRRLSHGGVSRVTYHPDKALELVWSEPSKFGTIVFTSSVPTGDPTAAKATCRYSMDVDKLLP
jgi:hypothetical protein